MRILFKALIVGLLVILILGVVMGAIAARYTTKYLTTFFSTSHASFSTLREQALLGLHQQPIQTENRKNFLILGLDELEGRSTTGILTDTMMVVSLRLDTGKITMISIPRDLWIEKYKTKINALYFYGRQKDAQHPETLVKEVVQEIMGSPIHHVVVVKMNIVAKLVDILGGVDIQIERTFEDTQFPKPGVDVATIRDSKVLYETVRFEQGTEHMNGERALKFIRSRHSTDLIEGTDEGRADRQRIVLHAIVSKIFHKDTFMNPERMAQLYLLYTQEYEKDISLSDLVATAKTLRQKIRDVNFKQFAIPIQKKGSIGILFSPPIKKHTQWVFEPVDPTWKETQTFFKGIL